ncbi:MAG: DNA mismatch repair endonuclease MutL [Candidatus Omnitrophica bacterium]|nr:DNA mismatch repair endonuclease MutL [Candidatus Omnitrophota bacterium]
MPRINILPPNLVSKIAAGEVIERPASVIKECVENSLDAGATSVEIHLKNAGTTLIHIKDNGGGIDRDDLERIFLRHATSKIKNEDDLYQIHSLGFRGEALYSIAAIADVTLKSKTEHQPEGWEIHIRGTERLGLKPAATPGHGTEMEIKELFYNTPARKKFLKSSATEINQILNTFIPYTLLYPSVRFLLTHQGNNLIDLLPSDSLTKRIAQALHLEEKYLLEKIQDNIHLVLGDMNIKRARRDLQFIFVNGRPVQNKNISFHLNQIYRLIMPEGDVPFFCVFIAVPPEDVDVNVHPSKREVKLKDEQEICLKLRILGEETLMRQGNIKVIVSDPSQPICHSRESGNPGLGSKILDGIQNPSRNSKEILDPRFREDDRKRGWDDRNDASNNDFPQETPPHTAEQIFFIPPEEFSVGKKENLQAQLQHARLIGAFLNKYLFFEQGRSLLLMDQHAAAERINYEKFLNQIRKGQVEVQHLLTPTVIPLSPQELIVWEETQTTLETVGFSNNQWDNKSIAIHSHPAMILNIERAVRNLLADEKIAQDDWESIARRACRASVMTGDYLNAEQADGLRLQLLECFDPFTCPHGRPTVVEITEEFLDKQFLR